MRVSLFVFFFNDTAPTEIYTLSLHDALPIYAEVRGDGGASAAARAARCARQVVWVLGLATDRKSTRLNSSHSQISYAVFCLKKKKQNKETHVSPTHQQPLHLDTTLSVL